MVIPIGSLEAAQQMSRFIYLSGTEHYESSAAYALAIETAEGAYMRTCVTYYSVRIKKNYNCVVLNCALWKQLSRHCYYQMIQKITSEFSSALYLYVERYFGSKFILDLILSNFQISLKTLHHINS